MMTFRFRIHEAKEENHNEYEVYEREFKSLEELMEAIDSEWWWARVEIDAKIGYEIWLHWDESHESEAWNE